jgi:toxin secretion/phage lysis holin
MKQYMNGIREVWASPHHSISVEEAKQLKEAGFKLYLWTLKTTEEVTKFKDVFIDGFGYDGDINIANVQRRQIMQDSIQGGLVHTPWTEQLRAMTYTQDKLIIFTLMLILGAMGIDFVLGALAAKVNPNIEFRSKEGINGILRKLGSIVLLSYCIPLSILLPPGIGEGTLQLLYFGYLFYELKSILENLEKLGIDAELFRLFFEKVKQIIFDKKEDEHDNNHTGLG